MTLPIRTGLSALDSDDKDGVRSTGVLVHVGAAKVQGDKQKKNHYGWNPYPTDRLALPAAMTF